MQQYTTTHIPKRSSFRIFVYTANPHELILQMLSILLYVIAVSTKQWFQIAFVLTQFTKFTRHIWVVN